MTLTCNVQHAHRGRDVIGRALDRSSSGLRSTPAERPPASRARAACSLGPTALAMPGRGPLGLDKPFIKTSSKATVMHLKKYLCKKLGVGAPTEVPLAAPGRAWPDARVGLTVRFRPVPASATPSAGHPVQHRDPRAGALARVCEAHPLVRPRGPARAQVPLGRVVVLVVCTIEGR